MRNSLICLLMACFAFSACTNEILNYSEESLASQTEDITSFEKANNDLVCKILQNEDDFYADFTANSVDDIQKKFDDYIGKQKAGQNPDPISFFVNDLQINAKLIDEVSNYGAEAIAIIDKELANPNGNGPLSQARQSGRCNVVQDRKTSCQRAWTGFVRVFFAHVQACGDCSSCTYCDETTNDLQTAYMEVIEQCLKS